MKNSKYILSVAAITTLLCSNAMAQDIHFSQFTEAQSLMNPATTGLTSDVRATMHYRNQWRTVASPYKTFAVTADMRNKSQKFGWGINFFSDAAGDASLKTVQGNINLTGHIPLNDKSKLSGGLFAGFAQRSINPSKLKWESQFNGTSYDPNINPGENFLANSFTYPDCGVGMVYSFGQGEMYIRSNDAFKFNIGYSLHHLNQPKLSFLSTNEKMYMKHIVHGGMLIGIKNTKLDIVPSFMYAQQGAAREILFGGMFKYLIKEDSKYTGYVKGQYFSLGAFYRNKDAVIVNAMFEMGQMALGISYDVNTSSLNNISNYKGGLEVSLRFISAKDFVFSKAKWMQ